MEDYSYMCGECFQFCDSLDSFIHHVCISNTSIEYRNSEETRTNIPKKDPGTSEPVAAEYAVPLHSKEKIYDQIPKDHVTSVQEFSDVDIPEDENISSGACGKKRKKYQAMADEYRVNRIMRDKDFKLGRAHLYSFKDTLGDWDERSTKLLICLIQKYPRSHFLLHTKAERRLGHWENIHHEMEAAGYTFTVLQLRMRWREVLQKYRWTVNYNDSHEVKKKCEYFDEMISLFGDWDKEATQCLIKQMQQLSAENKKKKIIRIGYTGWERITSSLNSEGHRFTIDMVEARWRNMVTLYKTMVDHNALPNVEPHTVAYQDDLENILKYVPKRRQIYEKAKGRSVKMERFPTNVFKFLLQAYKDCIDQFMDPKVKNAAVWDEIKQKLELEGYTYTTVKLKEILNGIIKGYEKIKLHNSLPGAIRRDVPYYRELSEIYGAQGRWPHIQTSRTKEMRNSRKFRLRLQASQQLWSFEESKALLDIYPDVLEAHVNQNVSHQASDLWLQVAKAYAASGYPKHDVPEIAVHIGLLRMGYAQGNAFPFMEEMRKVKETEEAVCYSPDVSKFTGDVEIIYWSHEAVRWLLELYLKHQSSTTSHLRKDEVFEKIKEDMDGHEYRYTKEEIYDHFKTLIIQFRTRTSKLWSETTSSRKTCNPKGDPYLELLGKVFELRRKMSLSWTSGVMPLNEEAVGAVYEVAFKKATELFQDLTETDEKKAIPQLIEQIQSHIRREKLLVDVPRTRQIRVHLVSALKRFQEGNEENEYVARLHEVLKANGMDAFFNSLQKEDKLIAATRSSKRKRSQFLRDTDEKDGLTEIGILSDSDSSNSSQYLKLTKQKYLKGKACRTNSSKDVKSDGLSDTDTPGLDDVCEDEVTAGHFIGKGLGGKCSKTIEKLKIMGRSSASTSSEENVKKGSCSKVGPFVYRDSKDIICNQGKDSRSSKSSGDWKKEGCIEISEKKKIVPGMNDSSIESSRKGRNLEAKTKLIYTRSGRKTRFTFFSDSLKDNFDEEDELRKSEFVAVRAAVPRKLELKDKSTQSDLIVPSNKIVEKSNRPRSVGTTVEKVNERVLNLEERAKSKQVLNLEERAKSKQVLNLEERAKSKQAILPSKQIQDEFIQPSNSMLDCHPNKVISKKNLISESMSKSHNSNVKDDNLRNSGFSDMIVLALEKHKEERIGVEKSLFDIIEKNNHNENVVLKQMLDILKGVKSIS